jgi:hypothetical protein
MAKTSVKAREAKRAKMVVKYAEKRACVTSVFQGLLSVIWHWQARSQGLKKQAGSRHSGSELIRKR